MATVIIRLAENHFISRRAEGMLGNGWEQVCSVQWARMQTDVSAAVYVCRLASALNMKGTGLVLGVTTCVLLLTTAARSVGLMKTSSEN